MPDDVMKLLVAALLVPLASIVACTRSAPRSDTTTAPTASTHTVPGADAGAMAREHRSAASTVEVTPPTSRDAGAPWPSALPTPTLPSPGAIKVVGYPADLRKCLPDPAHVAGFTKDGSELGYCMRGMALKCELVDRAGKVRTLDTFKDDQGPAEDKSKLKQIEDWLKEAALPRLPEHDCMLRPPALEGMWPYSDITLHVIAGDPSFKKTSGGDELVSQPFVRIGGALAGQKPVFPITIGPPHLKLSPPSTGEIPFNVTELNAFVLSPDGADLGIVVHSYCMEWCDHFEIRRLPVSAFASLVYNDAGFRAYEKGDLATAADLFLRAAYVDRTRELPAYNLACVYARQGDPKAKDALALAIARGGPSVKERAKKDKDFTSVKSQPWFESLVR